MDDLAGKLSELLNSPEGMERIKNLAGLLGQSAPPAPPAPPAAVPSSNGNPLGLDGDTLKTIMKVAPLLSNFRQEDNNTRLLRALRPMLSCERQKKLDDAIQLMQMMRILPMLKGIL